jgi:hypothetical protein
MISVFENDKQNVIGVVGSELFNKRIREWEKEWEC